MSIKKKFATAVATAGLLAGLFGSAFVPAVKGAVGVIDATNSTYAETNALDGTGTSAAPLELWADDMAAVNEADATITFTLKDSSNNVLNTVGVDISTSGAISVCDGVKRTTDTGTTGADGTIVIEVCADTTTTSGLGTLTVSAGGGSETVNYKVYGPAVTATIADDTGFTALAVGTIGGADSVSITCKDASGYDLSGLTAAFADNCADADITWTLTADSVGAAADVTTDTAADDGLFQLALTACDAGEEGDVFAFYGVVSGSATSVTREAVTSNTLTFTCTGAEIKIITGVTILNSSVSPGGTQKLIFHGTDADGLECGLNCVLDVSDHTISAVVAPADEGAFTEADPGAFADLTLGGNTSDADGMAADTFTSSGNNPGQKSIVVSIADTDQTTAGAQAAEYTVRYTVTDPNAVSSGTIAASVNAAKRIATFTLSAAANKLVTITVERISDGKVWTYYRKANASGVATFLIRKFGRFDVFASYSDDVTDTVRMRRR